MDSGLPTADCRDLFLCQCAKLAKDAENASNVHNLNGRLAGEVSRGQGSGVRGAGQERAHLALQTLSTKAFLFSFAIKRS